ncbi:hypothetical protein MUK42_35398 [Musa troglodytarum]|uniref:Uncharacterized protein n=1 Tax=Musa troglodytarum TaxID=320322 RepID=A0A9E7JBT3_9LILI|nr:hypothetical protein MUK42_35398 [Musa troglodytarum]
MNGRVEVQGMELMREEREGILRRPHFGKQLFTRNHSLQCSVGTIITSLSCLADGAAAGERGRGWFRRPSSDGGLGSSITARNYVETRIPATMFPTRALTCSPSQKHAAFILFHAVSSAHEVKWPSRSTRRLRIPPDSVVCEYEPQCPCRVTRPRNYSS